MPIPESQLDTWRNQGATVGSADTYKSIKAALSNANLSGWMREPYLQGSYANSTNIRGNSDVDIVAEMTAAHYYDTSRLNSVEKEDYAKLTTSSNKHLKQFRELVTGALVGYYGNSRVTPGNKCVTVAGTGSTLDADVVVCAEYRVYRSYSAANTADYYKGIVFWTQHGNEKVVNFPRQHRENGEKKNISTGNQYKPHVRMIKNAVTMAVERRLLQDGVSPSYFTECLAYNMPSSHFVAKSTDTFINFLNWGFETDLTKCTAGNGLRWLFGAESTQWTTSEATEMLHALVRLWEQW